MKSQKTCFMRATTLLLFLSVFTVFVETLGVSWQRLEVITKWERIPIAVPKRSLPKTEYFKLYTPNLVYLCSSKYFTCRIKGLYFFVNYTLILKQNNYKVICFCLTFTIELPGFV